MQYDFIEKNEGVSAIPPAAVFLTTGMQVLVTSAAISVTTMPGALLRLKLLKAETKQPFNSLFRETFNPSTLFANRHALAGAMKISTTGGMVKSGMRTPSVNEHFAPIGGEGQVKLNAISQEVTAEEYHKRYTGVPVSAIMFYGGVIGAIETAGTNYFDNKALHTKLNGPFKVENIDIRFKLFANGMPTKLMRNSINASLCLASTSFLQEKAALLFPKETYGELSTTFGIVSAGIVSGVLTNPFDVINKMQIIGMKQGTFSVPSAWELTKKVYQEQGLKDGFMRGTVLGSFQTIVAFATIHLVNVAFEAMLDGVNTAYARSRLNASANTSYVPELLSAKAMSVTETAKPSTSNVASRLALPSTKPADRVLRASMTFFKRQPNGDKLFGRVREATFFRPHHLTQNGSGRVANRRENTLSSKR